MVAVPSLAIGLKSLILRVTNGSDATNSLLKTQHSGKTIPQYEIKSVKVNTENALTCLQGQGTPYKEEVPFPCPG